LGCGRGVLLAPAAAACQARDIMTADHGSSRRARRLAAVTAAAVALSCCCGRGCAQPAAIAWPSSCPAGPRYLGCFHDHDPTFGKPEFVGPRHLEWGVPGCSGWGGCGSPQHGRTDCLPWPAGVEPCAKGKITRAYCAQQCLLWSPTFIYSGAAFANECWCDTKQEGPDVNTLAEESDCKTPCVGDKAETCGGTWFGSVSLCESAPWGAPLLSVLLPCLAVYVAGGVAYGRRTGGGGGGGGGGLLEAHPHWALWREGAGLCADGLTFARAGGGRDGSSRSSARTAREPLMQHEHRTDEESPKASRSKSSSSKKESRKSSSSSGGGSSARKKEGKQQQSKQSTESTDGSASASGSKADRPAGDGGRWVHITT
jgi:hypothetical protein